MWINSSSELENNQKKALSKIIKLENNIKETEKKIVKILNNNNLTRTDIENYKREKQIDDFLDFDFW